MKKQLRGALSPHRSSDTTYHCQRYLHLPHTGKLSPVERAGGVQINVVSVQQVFGCKAVVHSPMERRHGAAQETTRKCHYLGMAKEVSSGYKLLQYNVAENGMLEFIGNIFEGKPGRVRCYPDHFPMR